MQYRLAGTHIQLCRKLVLVPVVERIVEQPGLAIADELRDSNGRLHIDQRVVCTRVFDVVRSSELLQAETGHAGLFFRPVYAIRG